MELKVWVDGIQRVVCGVSDDTTCHDVIIALANAMGRTGRFTLIEKWRDIERPLPPNEYPARALQKWGEYASEVKLHLCQSETNKKNVQHEKQHKNVDKFSHAFSPPDSSQSSESLIKRSSTFSGSHNLNPLPKSHRDQLTARLQPIVENRQSTGLQPLPHSSSCSPSFPPPIPSPRRKVSPHRTSSPLRLPSPRNMLNHSPNTSTSPHNIVCPLPNRPHQNHNIHNDSSKFNVYSNHEHLEERGTDNNFPCQIDVRNNYISGDKSCSHPRDELVTIEHSLDSSGCSHSRSASLEIEEYDLDRNFPDILRDSNRTERPSIHTEYKLEPEVNIVHQGESEHDRLVRLVSVQLERIKTQESQIDMVDTEILSMEEKDIEYEEELEKITKEFVMLEHKHREEESDLTHLESVSLQDELSKSQNHDKEINLQFSNLNNKRQICEKQILEEKLKESQFSQNIEVIKNDIVILKQKLSKEESTLHIETGKLKIEITQKLTEGDELETNLKHVDQEIKSVDSVFAEKEKEIDKMEEELKEENIKCLDKPDTRIKDSSKTENREAILKILEGRLSPRPKSTQNDIKTSQAFINSLSTKNPNGVWV